MNNIEKELKGISIQLWLIIFYLSIIALIK